MGASYPARLNDSDLALPQTTRERLAAYLDLLARWNGTHNLVSAATLHDAWRRHILDSLQLLDHAPAARTWIDLGSGAGLPGLVVAIARAGDPGFRMSLVEANAKKCAFLRAAARETGAVVTIACARIEDFVSEGAVRYDAVSARALAPLEPLCAYAAPLLAPGGVFLAPKGKGWRGEEREASRFWRYDLEAKPSLSDKEGVILLIRSLEKRKAGA